MRCTTNENINNYYSYADKGNAIQGPSEVYFADYILTVCEHILQQPGHSIACSGKGNNKLGFYFHGRKTTSETTMTTTNSVVSSTASSSSSIVVGSSSPNSSPPEQRSQTSNSSSQTQTQTQSQQAARRAQPPLMHSVSIVVDLAKEHEHSLDLENHGGKDNLSKSIGNLGGNENESESSNSNNADANDILTPNFRGKTATEGRVMTTVATTTVTTVTTTITSVPSSSASSAMIKSDSKTMVSAKDGHECGRIDKMELREAEFGQDEEVEDNDDDDNESESVSDEEVDIVDADGDEEEDDEDGADCLRSELARKVVIVDEADKILRNRAHSAEPRICVKTLESVYERSTLKSPTTTTTTSDDACTSSNRNPNQVIGRLFSGEEVEISSPINSINKRSNTVANIDFDRLKEKYQADFDRKQMTKSEEGCRAATSSKTVTSGATSASSRETSAATTIGDIGNSFSSKFTREMLARKIEPSKLSMRRYTHHHAGSGSGFTSPHSFLSLVPISVHSTEQGEVATTNTLPSLPPPPPTCIRSSINHSVRTTVQPAARLGSAQLTEFSSPRIEGRSEERYRIGIDSGGNIELGRNNNIASSSDPLQSSSSSPSTSTSTSTAAASTTRTAISQQLKQHPQLRNNLTPTSSQQMKNWSPHRRQSLQISLLTGFASSSSQSVSLTEEELRGEREFNEQVRLAKSPDIQATALTHSRSQLNQQQQFQLTTPHKVLPIETASCLVGNTRSQSKASVVAKEAPFQRRARCESLAGGEIFSAKRQSHSLLAANLSTSATNDSTTSPHFQQPSDQQPNLAAILSSTGNNKQYRGRFKSTNTIFTQDIKSLSSSASYSNPNSNSSSNSSQPKQAHKTQRRVSFGSIDPIPSHSESRTHSRASFAYYPTYYQPILHHYLHHQQQQQQQQSQTKSANDSLGKLFSISHSDTASGSTTNSTTSPQTVLTSCEGSINSGLRSPTTVAAAAKEFNLDSTLANYVAKQQHQQHPATTFIDQKRHSIATHSYIESIAELANQTTTLRQHNPSHRRLIDQTQSREPQITRRVSVKEISDFFNTAGNKICASSSTKDDNSFIASSLKTSINNSATTRTKMNENENNPNTTSATINQQQQRDTTSATNVKPHLDDHESQMETYSTKLEGQDTDDLGITSSTSTGIQLASSNQEKDDSRVRSIMANAKLRQEEFARLLEEHEQIVNEINRVETKISSSQTSLQQHKQQQQPSQTHQNQENNQ